MFRLSFFIQLYCSLYWDPTCSGAWTDWYGRYRNKGWNRSQEYEDLPNHNNSRPMGIEMLSSFLLCLDRDLQWCSQLFLWTTGQNTSRSVIDPQNMDPRSAGRLHSYLSHHNPHILNGCSSFRTQLGILEIDARKLIVNGHRTSEIMWFCFLLSIRPQMCVWGAAGDLVFHALTFG